MLRINTDSIFPDQFLLRSHIFNLIYSCHEEGISSTAVVWNVNLTWDIFITLVTAQRHHSQTPGKSDLTADKSLFALTSQNLDQLFDSYKTHNGLDLSLIVLLQILFCNCMNSPKWTHSMTWKEWQFCFCYNMQTHISLTIKLNENSNL